MGFILWLVFGGIVGWLASMITKNNERMGLVANVVVGIIGSLIPIGVTVYGYTKLFESQTLNLDSMFKLVEPTPMVWEISAIVLIAGASIGAIGSLISVSRRLRWTR